MSVRCPSCGQEVDPEDPDTIQAYEQAATPTFGEPDDRRDGMRAAFHPGCWIDGDPNYRRAE